MSCNLVDWIIFIIFTHLIFNLHSQILISLNFWVLRILLHGPLSIRYSISFTIPFWIYIFKVIHRTQLLMSWNFGRCNKARGWFYRRLIEHATSMRKYHWILYLLLRMLRLNTTLSMIKIIRVNWKLEVAIRLFINDLQAVIVLVTALYIANIACIIINIIKCIIIITTCRGVILQVFLRSLFNLGQVIHRQSIIFFIIFLFWKIQ